MCCYTRNEAKNCIALIKVIYYMSYHLQTHDVKEKHRDV